MKNEPFEGGKFDAIYKEVKTLIKSITIKSILKLI